MTETSTSIRPRFGTFLTMVVGVLLVFGFLSQAQQVYEAVYVEEPTPREGISLSERRQRELIVIGARAPEAGTLQRTTPTRGIVGQPPPPDVLPHPVPDVRPDHGMQVPPPPPVEEVEPFRAPPPPPPPGPRHYTVRNQGETLYGIAKTIYGDGNQWRAIRDANPTLENPNRIFPGMRLVIPPPARMTPTFRAWVSDAAPPARQTL